MFAGLDFRYVREAHYADAEELELKVGDTVIARTVSASSSRSTPRTKRGACFKAVAATYAASLSRA